MRYSNTLLKRYLSVHLPHEEIIQAITLKSCEVEEWTMREIPELVVLGKIIEIGRHPDADKLFVCKLDCGKAGIFQICTGGENALLDAYVAVALPGCHLPAINLSIAPRMMRGLESNGMICSKNELGIPEDTDQHWIWILQYPATHVVWPDDQLPDMHDITDDDLGLPLKEKYPRLENWMVEVENKTITHRPDLFGHLWLANELYAIFGTSTHYTNLTHVRDQLTSTNCLTLLEHMTKSSRNIQIQSDHVRAYGTIDLNAVTVQRSDLYIRTLLYDLDITPKNNWVDFSNLFMYLTGQPIHCFDAVTIQGDIIVRQAHAGETFVDLHGKEHSLLPSDIVIADTKGVIALAGIIGGERTAVSSSTTTIVVEIANFDPVTVRRTGTRLGLRTDAELRFEKMINPLFSLAMIPHLMDTLSYVDQTKTVTFGGITWRADSNATTAMPRLPYERKRIGELLRGTNQPQDAESIWDTILHQLGFTLGDDRAQAPIWRSPKDCLHTADLLEEIARIHGYDTLQAQTYTDVVDFKPTMTEIALADKAIKYMMHTCHATQLETYPWYDTDQLTQLWLPTNHLFQMANSLRPEWLYLKDTMLRNLLTYAQKNLYQQPTWSIFDIGKTRNTTTSPTEQQKIALVYRANQPHTHAIDHPFLTQKWHIEKLLTLLVWSSWTCTPTKETYAHPAQQIIYHIGDTQVGKLFTVHPALLLHLRGQEHPCQGTVVGREINLSMCKETLSIEQETSPHTYATLQDQLVTKDISLLVDLQSNLGNITSVVKERFPAITAIDLFDIYAGATIPTGKKSVSLRLTMLGDGTRTSEQFNAILQEVVSLAQQSGATMRA